MLTLSHVLRRSGRIAREALLTLAALGGAACILFAVLAFAGGYSLMLFKTGSMAPTIPAGSVALVQRVPASDLRTGDIVTVDRPGALPITHRVTSIEEGAASGERIITMRGDANAADDPTPYTISDARIVRGSVPHLASVLAQFGNPWVLGGLTLGAAALVSWAFWPRKRPSAEEADDLPDDVDDPAVMTRRAPALRSLAVLATAGAALAVGVAAPAEPATAADSNVLVVHSDLAGAGVQHLDAVEPLYWHLDVDALAAPADGELSVSYSATGDAGLGLRAEVRSCATAWNADETCPSGERVLREDGLLPPDAIWNGLWNAKTPAAVHLRIALTADPIDPSTESAASVTVRATAAGETVDSGVDGEPPLAATGGSPLGLLAAPAAVLIGIGIALLARRRPDRRTP